MNLLVARALVLYSVYLRDRVEMVQISGFKPEILFMEVEGNYFGAKRSATDAELLKVLY